ncbi:MAG: hypothetical protein ACI4EA_11810 [Candidatus Ornithomonoglobus sp.]
MRFESDMPTEADIRYDAYIRSIVINTNKNIVDRLKFIYKEISYDDLIESKRKIIQRVELISILCENII